MLSDDLSLTLSPKKTKIWSALGSTASKVGVSMKEDNPATEALALEDLR